MDTVTRYSSWAVYGEAMEGVANDAAFHKLVTEMHGFSELMSRNITVETDL